MMRPENPKQDYLSEELLERAVEFHGHGGPFMVVGLRMGLAALRELEARGWFDISCRVELAWRPPDSCIIDGIQCSTGCTMGKHNIEVTEKGGVAAEFTKGSRSTRIVFKDDVLEKMRRAAVAEEDMPALVRELMTADPKDLFEVH